MSEAITKATDEQIRKTVESIQDPDTVPAFHNGYYTLTPDELRRAIIALRPSVEPMTPEQRDTAIDAKLAEYGYPANTRNAARAGWYACLQALGITAKADGDPNAKS